MASARTRKAQQTRRRNNRRTAAGLHGLWGWIGWGAAGGGVLALILGIWIWFPPNIWGDQIGQGIQQITASMGFRVQQVMISGRQEVPLAAIEQRLAIQRGAPILAYNADALITQLQTLPKIKTAFIHLRWPDTVLVQVVERTPVARWQREQQIQLIDADGVVIGLAKTEDSQLPLIVGDAAPQAHATLWPVLQQEPELYNQVRAAVYVGQRRWDLLLKNQTRIKLPAQHLDTALRQFWAQPRRAAWLNGGAELIDLRLVNKIVVRPMAQSDDDDHSSLVVDAANPA